MRFATPDSNSHETPLAPLLDVVLLLLIFFVVTTSFVERKLPIDLPSAEASVQGEGRAAILELDATGSMSLDGQPVGPGELPARLAEVAVAGLPVELRADSAARHGEVVRVLDILSQEGLDSIGIAVSASSREAAADESMLPEN